MSKVLVVVDAQRDFITGSLKNEMADKTVENILNKIKEAVERNERVIFTFDTHSEDYLNTLEGKHLPVEHCIYDTDGWKLDKRISEYLKEKMSAGYTNFGAVNKPTFGSMKVIDEIVKDSTDKEFKDIESVEFVGFCTGICVVSNALLAKTRLMHTDVYVDASCCACITPEKHEAALDTLENCQVIVTNRGKEIWKA